MPGSIWKHWNWLESGLIPLTAALMRAAWLTPFVHFLLNNVLVVPQGTSYPAWLILALLLGASALRHAWQEDTQGLIRATLAGLAVVLIVLGFYLRLDITPLTPAQLLMSLADFSMGIPAMLLVCVITAALWRYGLTINWGYFGELWHSFLVGVIALGILMLVPSSAQGTSDLALWNAMLLFLTTGLLALALLAVADTLASENWRSGKMPALNRHWLVATGSMILMILLAGLLLGQILSPRAVQSMLHTLGSIVALIGQVLLYTIGIIAYVIFWLLTPLINKIAKRPTPDQPPLLPQQRPLAEQFGELETQLRHLTPEATNTLRILFVVLLVVVIVVVFALAWRRAQRRRRNGGVLEEREFILSKDLLLEQLRGLLRRKERPQAFAPYLALPQPDDPRQAIRLLYQKLLAQAQALGQPRPPGVTPWVYQQLLAHLLPTELTALSDLTALYLLARYAPDPPTPPQVDDAQRAYARIDTALQDKRASA
jgi:hypothetical protein